LAGRPAVGTNPMIPEENAGRSWLGDCLSCLVFAYCTRQPETPSRAPTRRRGGWSATLTLEASGAQCLAVDPADDDVVYAGLRSGGVRKSSDGGATWVDCELPAEQVFSLAVSPADGAVYAGCEPSALLRSDDGGRSWIELESSDRGASWADHRPGAQRDVYFARLAPEYFPSGLRSRRWRRGVEQGQGRYVASRRRGPRPTHLVCRRRSG
jgi:hypothetical protein